MTLDGKGYILAQTDAEINREPLVAAGASQYQVHQKPPDTDHPLNYFVPDFGVDVDIKAALSTTNAVEKA